MNTVNAFFFEILQITVGTREILSRVLSVDEWKGLLDIVKEQALIGVCYSAIERLPKEQLPPQNVMTEWFAMTQQIEQQSEKLDKASARVCSNFKKEGFDACILKGQGIALLYPQPRRRQSGDVDVWVKPKACLVKRQKSKVGSEEEDGSLVESLQLEVNSGKSVDREELIVNFLGDKNVEEDVKKVIRYVRGVVPGAHAIYYHIKFPVFKDVEVEVHYRPGYLSCFWHNRRLQRWFLAQRDTCFGNEVELKSIMNKDGNVCRIYVPTAEFNFIFMLCHIYRHLFGDGIGLRQVMDYYYLCERYNSNGEYAGKKMEDLLKLLGLHRLAGALMWVLQEVFLIERTRMIVEPDEKVGRMMLDEIMMRGNFGTIKNHYDVSSIEGRIRKVIEVFLHNLKFLRYYPAEVLCTVPFKFYHWLWRRSANSM